VTEKPGPFDRKRVAAPIAAACFHFTATKGLAAMDRLRCEGRDQ